MRSHHSNEKLEARQKDAPSSSVVNQPAAETEALNTPPEPDENYLDESDLQDVDDDRWDVFILDDDDEPLPDYGDFWFPD